ncbi:MAG TPA: response regulator [Planctomycetota bacterium]|nr:response regulator [Planctomycetota bacterium]
MADDDASIRTYLAAMLSGDGWEVDWCEDGVSALEAARSGAHELLILDVLMPRLTGLEVLREVRAWGSRVPVMLISGTLWDGVIRAASAMSGPTVCLAKPFGPADVRRALARLGEAVRRGFG